MPMSGGPSPNMVPPDLLSEASPWRAFPEHLPPERRLVLCRVSGLDEEARPGLPDVYAIGYLQVNSGGPFFVIPGYPVAFRVLAWADVLPPGIPVWSITTGWRA